MGAPILIEVKSTDDVSRLTLGGELALMSNVPASRRLVLSRDTLLKKLAEGIEALPWRKGLAEIFDLHDQP